MMNVYPYSFNTADVRQSQYPTAQPTTNAMMPGMQTGTMPGMQTGVMPGTQMGAMPGMQMGGVPPVPSGSQIGGVPVSPGTTSGAMLPTEESYIENILRLNLGKMATIYMTFENNSQWNAKVFRGILEAAGRDHIIISDPKTGMRYLLLMINLDYVTFDEELQYAYPFR